MRIVNISEAKTQLSRWVSDAAHGEEIIIAKAGIPAARLVPIKRQLLFGTLKGKFTVPVNFDEPLPDEVIKLFECE